MAEDLKLGFATIECVQIMASQLQDNEYEYTE